MKTKQRLEQMDNGNIVLLREYHSPTYARIRARTNLSRFAELSALRDIKSHRHIVTDVLRVASRDLGVTVQKVFERLAKHRHVDFHASFRGHYPRDHTTKKK